MTKDTARPLTIDPADRISLDDIRARAEKISNLAASEVKRATAQVTEAEISKVALVAVGVIVVVASLGFLLGSRAARRSMSRFAE